MTRWWCRHRRRRMTGETQVRLDDRGNFIFGSAKLVYRCCDCRKEIVG